VKVKRNIERPDKEAIYCAPRYYDKLIKVTEFSVIGESNPFYGYSVIPSVWCDENKAYAVDDNWDITTIIISPHKR
jgi:hypothetical protein